MPRCLYCLTPYVTQAEGRQEQACECGEMVCEQDQRDAFDAETSRVAQLAIDEAIAEVGDEQ